MPEKPHISASQIDTFSRCNVAWFFRYIEGLKIPPGIALLVGSGVHKGIEGNMSQKIETHRDLTTPDIQELAVAGFAKRIDEDGIELTDTESAIGRKKTIGQAIDMVASLAELHADEQAGDYQPVEVEHKTLIVLPKASRDILAYTDLRDDKTRITDFKTAGRSKSQADIDTSTQLTIYHAAYQKDHNRPPAEVRFDVLVKTKTPKRQLLIGSRSGADYLPLISRINAIIKVMDAITEGTIDPCPCVAGSWNCSPRWCGYWNRCPHVNSERKDAAR